MTYGALAAGIVGLALTAGLAGLEMTSRLRTKELPRLPTIEQGRWDDPVSAVALLEDGAARGPAAGWNELWSSGTRGAPSSDTALARLSVQLGARLVDLELANAARDTAAVRLLSARVVKVLEEGDVLGSGPIAYPYRLVAQDTGAHASRVDSLLAEGREGLRGRMPKEWLELGVWAETARTAAARRDAGFFRSRASRDALDRIDALLTGTGSADELAKVRRAVPVDDRADWNALETALRDLLRSAAGLRPLATVP
jgi:hypothetical protein